MSAADTTVQPVESLRDLAAEQAVLDLLAARVAAAKKDVRARTQRALDAAAERDGTERIAATLPDGEQVATISLRRGETGPAVVDEDAFARWVRTTFPDEQWTETRVVRTVKPWAAVELLANMAAVELPPGKTGARRAQWVDADTGEAHEVPGVVIKPTRARTHALTWRKTGRAAVAAAWRAGDLAAHIAALTATEEGSA
ncbi:hypothetical protein ACGH2B_12380 [Streptomyces sp. BBFR2]|uniref:hypothetical protein n=1 Tax=Streptomyces sp. BBFR2 TaxID=3372854 RepID=UPI0037DA520A